MIRGALIAALLVLALVSLEPPRSEPPHPPSFYWDTLRDYWIFPLTFNFFRV